MEVFLGRALLGDAMSARPKLIVPAGLFASCHCCREAAKSERGKMSALSTLTSVCNGAAPCPQLLTPADRLGVSSSGVVLILDRILVYWTMERSKLCADALLHRVQRYNCSHVHADLCGALSQICVCTGKLYVLLMGLASVGHSLHRLGAACLLRTLWRSAYVQLATLFSLSCGLLLL